ncbi:MAG: hypothetical protein AB1730_07800 [Myxococcota bacterium]|jgi:hypothetical protein
MTSKMLVVALLAFAAGALSACSGGDAKREVCNNGIDDDGNGKTDCADLDCAGQEACVGNMDAGFFGTCQKCGNTCGSQADCLALTFVDDRPIPYCSMGRCTALETFVQVRVQMDTKQNWSGLGVSPGSGSTRFIKKTGANGMPVTCAMVAATAADKTKPAAIEDSKAYVIQGLDVTRITNPQLGQGITYAFVNTQTGGDFLIWSELWGGPPNSSTKLPSGNRLGWGCYESAAEVGGPITTEDNCPSTTSDAGTCRTFNLVMPPPE